jgi:outer membrane protein W
MIRPIALLALSAAAVQAHSLEFQLGTSRPSTTTEQPGYRNNLVTGLSYAHRVSNQVSLGATVAQRDLEARSGNFSEEALSLTLDLTWELGSRDGGLKPFFGLGAGTTWLDEAGGESTTALTATAQGGLRFSLSEDLDLTVGMRHFRIFDVNLPVAGEEDVRGWETYLGLRLKF